jgi:hypothetical protein
MAVVTFGKTFESDSHVKPDYTTTGRARVEMSYHGEASFEDSSVKARSASRRLPALLPYLNREDEADIAEQ